MRAHYLKILGVSELADETEIVAAYNDLIQHKDDQDIVELIDDAYFFLTNEKCQEYGKWIFDGEDINDDSAKFTYCKIETYQATKPLDDSETIIDQINSNSMYLPIN